MIFGLRQVREIYTTMKTPSRDTVFRSPSLEKNSNFYLHCLVRRYKLVRSTSMASITSGLSRYRRLSLAVSLPRTVARHLCDWERSQDGAGHLYLFWVGRVGRSYSLHWIAQRCVLSWIFNSDTWSTPRLQTNIRDNLFYQYLNYFRIFKVNGDICTCTLVFSSQNITLFWGI